MNISILYAAGFFTRDSGMGSSLFRNFINGQNRISRGFDRWFPREYWLDGNHEFLSTVVPNHLIPNSFVYDIGGGSSPCIPLQSKNELSLNVIGLDISEDELAKAPAGSYDQVICVDLNEFAGKHDADLVVCQSVLEHLSDVTRAFQVLSTILKPGGTLLVFVPCRNALFARINLILPESLKKKLLFLLYPHMEQHQGFPAYYDRCTPKDFRALADQHRFEIVEERIYFKSSYFTFFFPLHFVWRLWVFLFRALRGDQAAETFTMTMCLTEKESG